MNYTGVPRVFLTPQFPDGLFLLADETGFTEARVRGSEVVLADEQTNTWVAYFEAGTPRWFRVVRQEDNRIWTLDGTGAEFVYDLVPIGEAEQGSSR